MKKVFGVTAALVLGLSIAASAAITIDTVRAGDPGNAADSASHSGNPAGQGSVSYNYNIGKYEVTAGQYTAFLNAVAKTDTYGLYNINMFLSNYGCGIRRIGNAGDYSYSVSVDWASRPVNFVSYWDACRFTNWLHNGQPTGLQDAGTTERGAYDIDGYNWNDGGAIQRSADWKWAVASEDEWYKAAYYRGGTDAGYWLYPTQSNSTPGQDMVDASGNSANHSVPPGVYPIDDGKYTTVAGEFQNSGSAYGTFDQGGNVWEWNEAILYQDLAHAFRGLRGGSFGSYGGSHLQSSTRNGGLVPPHEGGDVGFRVSQYVPEPSTVIALLSGFAASSVLRRRRSR